MPTTSGKTYTATKSGTGIVADGYHVPEDPGNRDWQTKLVDDAGGGTDADPAPTLGLADAKAAARRIVDAEAERRMGALLPLGAAAQTHWLLRRQEAIDIASDGTPTAGEFPLLNAEVGESGADLAEVAAAVLAEEAALRTALAPIVAVAVEARNDIEGCGNQSEIDAVLAAIVWPS